MVKSALVTGATGQDGSYLMELLLKKGYEVFGLVRRLSVPNMGNIQHIVDRVTLIDGDLIDQSSLNAAVKEADPDEVYSLADQSFVATSFVQRHVRRRGPRAAGRDVPVPSPESVWGGEGLRILGVRELSRSARSVRLERDPVQSRIGTARPGIPDAQGQPRSRSHPRRIDEVHRTREPGREARLGLRPGVRGPHVARAPA